MEQQAATGERSRAWTWVLIVGAVALALVLWGGYGHHWPWTGINGQTATLWDWLHLLLLPLAVAVLPIWLARDAKLDPVIKRAALAGAAVFAVVVVAGYTIPWAWTGFVGNTLWDWLNLAALPLAVALTPLAIELRATWAGRQTGVALVAAAVFAAIVLGGYLGHWTWTGFTGNTLWDWMHLLLLPLLLPILVVPTLVPRARARMVAVSRGGEGPADAPADEGPESEAPPSHADRPAGSRAVHPPGPGADSKKG